MSTITTYTPQYGTPTALTISLNALASSTGGAATQQSTIITGNTANIIHVTYDIILGTNPTSAKAVYFWFIGADTQASPFRDDQAGPTDAALTRVGMRLARTAPNKASGAATGDHVMGKFELYDVGPSWGIAVGHDTGVNLGSGSAVYYTTENEIGTVP